MAASSPKTFSVSCPKCGVSFVIGSPLAGKPGKCGKCGHVFTLPLGPVPPKLKATAPTESKPPKPAVMQPEFIGVTCYKCGTRMFGRPEQIGQLLQCPDCNAKTELKPPEPVKSNTPAAMEGEQYELWGVDEPPLPSEMAAAQPKYITIECRLCQSLLHATEDQVGKKIVCPDCGTPNIVPPPKAIKNNFEITPDAETPKIDPKSHPGERPVTRPIETRGMLYQEEHDAEVARREDLQRRGKLRGTQYDIHGRPIMPRWPLVTGVWRMLVRPEVLAPWILASLVAGISSQILAEALLSPIQGQAEAIKMLFTVFGMMLAGVALMIVAPLMVAMICDSSAGEDKLLQPPRLIAFDWWGEFFSVVCAASIASLCGAGVWQLGRLPSLDPIINWVISGAVILIVLPVTLLSTLLESSPFDVISARVFGSFKTCFGSWMLFYLEAFLLAALTGAAAWGIVLRLGPVGGTSTATVWALAPLVVGALLAFSRLLGRLGWVMSERLPPVEIEIEND